MKVPIGLSTVVCFFREGSEVMSPKSATAMVEVFVAALEGTRENIRREVILRLLKDDDLREDIEAALLWEERKDEPSRDLKSIMADWKKAPAR
jgi:hypothetical protein